MGARQYLAWGGEGDGFSIVTAGEIAKQFEGSHYSGFPLYTDYALLRLRDGEVELLPTEIEAGSRDVDGDDYVHIEYRIMLRGSAVVFDTFHTRIDGRA